MKPFWRHRDVITVRKSHFLPFSIIAFIFLSVTWPWPINWKLLTSRIKIQHFWGLLTLLWRHNRLKQHLIWSFSLKFRTKQLKPIDISNQILIGNIMPCSHWILPFLIFLRPLWRYKAAKRDRGQKVKFPNIDINLAYYPSIER